MTAYRKLMLLMFVLAGVTTSGFSGELLLGAMGKSNYQIVIPDKFPSKEIKESVEKAAELLQQAFKENDISLAIVSEEKIIKDKPGIYLGHTSFAVKNGIAFDKMPAWTYTFKVVGKNLIIAGNDQVDPMPLKKRREREASRGGIPFLGTLKATTEFLYKHAGVRFVVPGKYGIVFMPTPVIFIPDNLNITKRPYARDVEISRSKDIYAIANGREPAPLVLSNYGHYHQSVIIPKAKGGKKDYKPEYFILAGGERQTKGRNYCFSNKEVRELLYKKILEDCDNGYDIIEVGQNDGFKPCQCKKCYKLYGITPTHVPEDGVEYNTDPAFAEKLWIMHRDMALRLKKDRPGKKLMLSAYAVCNNPPTTFDSFPDNVIIQIMHPTQELFKKWSRMKVPGGYSVYLYTWGKFHVTGLTPIRSAQYIKNLVDLLIENKVSLIQNNGKPFTYGIEGINIYAFNRMMNDPDYKNIDELNDEYLEATYREGAGAMRSFYRKLHQQMNYMAAAIKRYKTNRDPLLAYTTIYTPSLMLALESALKNAEKVTKSPGAKQRLAATRAEFEYLKHIVYTIYYFNAFQLQKNEASLKLVVDAVENRNTWIKNLMKKDKDGNKASFNGIRQLSKMMSNGRRMDVEPFNWNIKEMRSGNYLNQQSKSLIVKKVNKTPLINSPSWNKIPVNKLTENRGVKEKLQDQTTFQVAYDNENIYIRFEAELKKELMNYKSRGRDPEIWLQECFNICIAPGGDKSQYFYLNFEPVANSFTDAQHGFITDTLHPKFGLNDNSWNGNWTYESVLLKNKDKWLAMVTLPYKTFKAETPKSGDMWYANFGRVHYKKNLKYTTHRELLKAREISVWTGKLNGSKVPGDGHFGEIIFE